MNAIQARIVSTGLAIIVFTLAAMAFAQETVLYSLKGVNGSFPANLIFDPAGNIYGAAGSGGNIGANCYGCGTIFKMSPAVGGGWNETTLYAFTGGTGESGGDGGNDYWGLFGTLKAICSE